MRFAQRTAWNTEETDLARAHRARLEAGLPLADLTASNPTRCGFHYPPEVLAALDNPAALDYDPNPRGLLLARQAVCAYYADHGAAVSPEQIILTTSTSEAYSFLFRLLCDPGDEILVPQPGYPLFDFLATLDDVRLKPAPLVYDYGWQIDPEGFRRAITPADARHRTGSSQQSHRPLHQGLGGRELAACAASMACAHRRRSVSGLPISGCAPSSALYRRWVERLKPATLRFRHLLPA